MVQKTVTVLVDDLDETEIKDGAGQTVRFGLDGKDYELDLTNEHADELRAALERYIGAARKVSGGAPRRGALAKANGSKSDASPKAVREWAKANKIAVSPRGRIPQSVIDQFHAAGN